MDDNEIGNFIKIWRKKTKLTQRELSMKSGVGLRFIREAENGKKTLRLDKINQLLYFFGHKLYPVKDKEQL